MPKVGQIIMYRRDVCEVKEIVKKFRDDKDYYKLSPCYDESLTIHAPAEGIAEVFRPLLSKAEVNDLIESIPAVEPVDTGTRMIENVYRDLFNSGKHEDLIRIIKTTYLRAEEKLGKGQKRSEKDKVYFRMAEDALYNELAIVLDKSVADTRDYVVERVTAIVA